MGRPEIRPGEDPPEDGPYRIRYPDGTVREVFAVPGERPLSARRPGRARVVWVASWRWLLLVGVIVGLSARHW